MNDRLSIGAVRDSPLRVLLLEPTARNAQLLQVCLRSAFSGVTVDVVGDEESFVDRLAYGDIDIVLSCYRLPGFDGAQALQYARTALPDTPFVFVSNVVGEDNIVEMLRQGATDYVSKDRLLRLPAVVTRALREAADRRACHDAEARAHKADALFTRVFESIREYAVVLFDPDGVITTWNRAAHAVFRYPLDAAPIGAWGSVLFTPEDRAAGVFEQELRTALALGKADDTRWLLRGDGRRFWAEGLLTPLYDTDGRHDGFSKIVRDATRAHEDAEKLRLANEAAQRASRAKSRFLAVLSHELRAPLAPIAAAAQVLERCAVVPEQYLNLLPMIRRNVALEARLIDELLDLTLISTSGIELDLEVIDMHALVREVAGAAGRDMGAKNLQFSLDLAATNVLVKADPARLRQALVHILGNAVKFTPDHGMVRLRTESSADDFLLACTDNGIGIEAEALPHVFDAFEQADPEVSKRFGGAGIGLALAAGIVARHAGRLSAASDGRNKGATITLVLPLAEALQAIRAPGAVLPQPALAAPGACRVLVVEDSVDAGIALVLALRVEGHVVTHAHTLAGALEAIRNRSFDIVISDLGLPDGNGVDVARALGGTVPAIALSGFGTTRDVQQSMAAGFSAHLVKPADLGTVLAAMQRVLTSHGSMTS